MSALNLNINSEDKEISSAISAKLQDITHKEADSDAITFILELAGPHKKSKEEVQNELKDIFYVVEANCSLREPMTNLYPMEAFPYS